jgi:type II secretory pathway pseudopilin PulG
MREMKIRTIMISAVIVVAFIAVGIAIALPSFIRARQTSAYNPCVNFLRMIDAGKEQASLAYGWPVGTECDSATNRALVNQYIKGNTTPQCPDGGTYTYNPLGKNPTCSVFKENDRKTWRHRLPE